MTAMKQASALDLDVLLVHRDFLTGMSRSLLSNPHDADDLSQETWLAAMKRAPAHDANLKGWIKTVASRFAFSDRRRRASRAAHEAAFAPTESTPSAADIAEREAVRREVVHAVLALSEPYRDPILLRYYEDLPPREIARRLRLPVETVRTRLRRGLQQMRGQLDATHGGDRTTWMAALAPIASPASQGTVSAIGVGGLLDAHRLLLMAALLSLVTVPAVLVALKGRGTAPPSPVEVKGANQASQPTAAAVTDREVAQADAARGANGVQATASLLIRGVVTLPDGSPAAGAEVAALGSRYRGASPKASAKINLAEARRLVSTFADDHGRFSLGPINAGLYQLIARGTDRGALGRARPIGLGGIAVVGDELLDRKETAMILRALGDDATLVRRGTPAVRDIALDDAVTVTGHVVDHSGHTIIGAEVAGLVPHTIFQSLPMPFAEQLAFLGPFAETTTSGADGSFRLSLCQGAKIAARKADYFAAHQTIDLDDVDLAERRLQLVTIPRVVLRGTVRDVAGVAIANAEVFLAHADDAARKSSVDDAPTLFDEVALLRDNARPVTQTLGDGSFTLDTPVNLDDDPWAEAPASWHQTLRLVAASQGYLPARGAPFTPDAAAPDGPGARELVMTQVLELRGVVTNAATGARIEGTAVTTSHDADGDGYPFTVDRGTSDAQGRFTLQAPAALPIVRVDMIGYETWYDRLGTGSTASGEEIVVRLTPAAQAVRGQVVDLAGAPLARMMKVKHDLLGEVLTSFYDVFAFADDPRGAYELGAAFDASTAHAIDQGEQARLEPDGSFQIAARAWPNGSAWLMCIVNDRVYEVIEARPGASEVQFRVDPAAGQEFSTLTLIGNDLQGRALPDLSFDVFREGDRTYLTHAFWSTRNQATAMVREAGTFRVVARAEGYGRATQTNIRLAPGDRIGPITVTLPPQRQLFGEVFLPGTERAPARGAIARIYSEDRLLIRSLGVANDGTFEVDGLSEGRVFVTVSGYQDGAASAWVDILPNDDSQVSLTLDGGSWLEVRLSDDKGPYAAESANLTVYDDQGFVRATLGAQIMRNHPTKLYLERGHYRLRSRGAGTATREVDFSIGEAGPTVIEWDVLHR